MNVIKRSPPSWFWWIRIHPHQIKFKPAIKKLLYEYGIVNFNIDDATDLPLYALLRNIDFHLTCTASVVIEAAEFRVPSVFVSKEGIDLFAKQIATGWAQYENKVDNIINIIAKDFKKRLNKTIKPDTLYIQNNKAIEQLVYLIKK